MAGDNGIDVDRLSWASLRPKLVRLLDSQSPHVRANLATLAASMGSDPDALDELASIGADAADSIAGERGDLRDVLSTVLAERETLDELERKRFDQFFATRLKREAVSWRPSQLAALLRKDLPIQLLPLTFVRDAVYEACTGVPVETRTPQDIRDLQDARSRIQPIITAAQAPGAEGRKKALAAAIHQRLTTGDEKQRDAVLFGLLELWPEMAQEVSAGLDDQKWITLVPAARMRRVGRRRLAGYLAVNLVVFCMVAFAIPRLGELFFQPASVSGSAGSTVIFFVGWSLMLALIGLVTSLPMLFLYTPTAILPTSSLMRLRINALPVIGAALVATIVFFARAVITSSEAFFIEGAALVLLLTLVTGGLTVVTAPVLRIVHNRAGRYRRLINGFSAAALPLLASGVILILLQPGNPEVAALLWAFVLVTGMGMGLAAWLAEVVPHAWMISTTLLPRERYLAYLSASALVLVVLVCVSPLAILTWTRVRPIAVALSGSRLEAPLREGRIYRLSGDRHYVVQVLHPNGYAMIHRLSVAKLIGGKPAQWELKSCPSEQSYALLGVDLNDQCIQEYKPTDDDTLVCYNCTGKSNSLIEFAEAGWPFRMGSRVHVDARLLIDGRDLRNGQTVQYGDIHKFVATERLCVQGQGFKLWRQGEATQVDQEAENAMVADTMESDNMVADPMLTDTMSADEDTATATEQEPGCPGKTVEPGQYSICYHDEAAENDCASRAGERAAAVRPGSAVFRYTPLKRLKPS